MLRSVPSRLPFTATGWVLLTANSCMDRDKFQVLVKFPAPSELPLRGALLLPISLCVGMLARVVEHLPLQRIHNHPEEPIGLFYITRRLHIIRIKRRLVLQSLGLVEQLQPCRTKMLYLLQRQPFSPQQHIDVRPTEQCVKDIDDSPSGLKKERELGV